MRKWKRFVFILMLCLACFALGGGAAMLWMQQLPVQIPQILTEPMVLEEEEEPQVIPEDTEENFLIPEGMPEESPFPESDETVGQIYVSDARKEYRTRSLRLVIPKLKIDEKILDGVSSAVLANGDGLYPYAQLPSEENGNVCIAGHRNGTRDGRPVPSRKFYYLNTLTEGDYLYLVYQGTVYQYLWECTEVVKPDNWDPIRNRGYGCITLTTCTPIGVADHRLVVRGELIATFPADSVTEFRSSRSAS